MHRDFIFIMALHYSYDDQLLVDYRVKCGENKLAFFNVTSLDIEGPNCIDEHERAK